MGFPPFLTLLSIPLNLIPTFDPSSSPISGTEKTPRNTLWMSTTFCWSGSKKSPTSSRLGHCCCVVHPRATSVTHLRRMQHHFFLAWAVWVPQRRAHEQQCTLGELGRLIANGQGTPLTLQSQFRQLPSSLQPSKQLSPSKWAISNLHVGPWCPSSARRAGRV